MKGLRLLSLLLCLVVLAAGSGCSRGSAGVTVAGSTSVEPFAELVAEEYMRAHPEAVVNVQGGGSSAGIQAALSGAAEIGMSSRQLKSDEAGQLGALVIALDAIAIIVHPSNPIADLTLPQVRQVFAGEVRNWKELGGADHRITVITREEGSGTRGAFQELVMGEQDIHPSSIVQDSNGAVRQVVADDPHAVGYVSLGLVNHQVKAVTVDGVEAANENVREGDYELVRSFIFVVKGEPEPPAQAYIDFVLSPKGQEVLSHEGLVPVK